MKNLIKYSVLTLVIFFMSHCKFQESNATNQNYKRLVSYNNCYSNFSYDEFTCEGMEYRVYFGSAGTGGICVINKTLDKLQKEKLELEIRQLKNNFGIK